MFDKKSIKISKELYDDLEKYISGKDYDSVSDFVEAFLAEKIRPELEEQKIAERLKGLGYIE